MANISNSNAKGVASKNLLIVDPNPCGSELINIEDLNISVELEVYRRSDDILIFNDSNNTFSNTSESNPPDTTRISFIDGSGETEKVLTTNYTEFNTKFNQNNPDLQTLGIENIDISFNTSYTPMVKIRFKDIRGKLFEMGNDSPYSFLFRMPYPIFYLTVKGYYGKAVRYPLHLIKFNGELDADSGSFIINCEFIGYTYAFLSDLLMGYLKAIPYTKIGSSLSGQTSTFVTIEQLAKKITELENTVIKFRNSDLRLKALTIYDDLLTKYENLSSSFTNSSNIKPEIGLIINENVDNNNLIYIYKDGLTIEDKKRYDDNIFSLVADINQFNIEVKTQDFKLNVNKFYLKNNGVYYENLNIDDFSTVTNGVRTYKDFYEFQLDTVILDKYPNFKIVNNPNNDTIVTNRNNEIENLYENLIEILESSGLVSNVNYFVIDLRFVNSIVKTQINKIKRESIEKTKEVSEQFSDTLDSFLKNSGIDFDASIGSLFKILCNHVDLFIRTLRQVGTEIDIDIKNGRRNILSTDKSNFSDYLNVNNQTEIKVKAFPEYVVDEDNSLVEKWLGSNAKFMNYKEVAFIDDLYLSLLKAATKDHEILGEIKAGEKGWYPINPLETKPFGEFNDNPWKSAGNLNDMQIVKLLTIRMFIFMSYSNKGLTDSEINNMAIIEANQAFENILNKQVKNGVAVTNIDEDEINQKIENWFGDNNTSFGKLSKNFNLKLYEKTVLFQIDKNLVLKYDSAEKMSKYDITQTKSRNINVRDAAFTPSDTFLFVNQSDSELRSELSTELNKKFNPLVNESFRSSQTKPFISTVISSNNDDIQKINSEEYETFIKIINVNDYNSNNISYTNYINSETPNSRSVKNFNTSEVEINTKSDILGGVYKTHEFILYENTKDKVTPLFYEFYSNGKEGSKIFNLRDNLKESFNDKRTIINGLKQDIEIKNNKYSLFGTDFYYQQTDKYARALLFLYTIPFAGLNKLDKTFFLKDNEGEKGLLTTKEINFFNQRAGFVSVPYSWILMMGGVLYRNQSKTDILVFDDYIGFFFNKETRQHFIDTNKYLVDNNKNETVLAINPYSKNNTYPTINDVILNLPNSVKQQFINEFIDWVDNGSWNNIKDKLEIFDENLNASNRNDTWRNSVMGSTVTLNLKTNANVYYKNILKNSRTNYFDLTINDGIIKSGDTILDNINSIVSKFLLEERIIINSTYRIWEGNEDRFRNFEIIESDFKKYLTTFLTTFSKLNITEKANAKPEIDNLNQDIFKTNNVDDIKLSIYKNVKSIYEKWIVGIPQQLEGTTVTNLYESFNFIDRSFNDISSKFKISPTGFIDYLLSNSNISFYNFIASILKDNNFDFIPLPTFVNFNNLEDVKGVFTPYTFRETPSVNKPKFICMYMGERSNKLDISNNDKINKDDGIILNVISNNCEKDGAIELTDESKIPKDFIDGNDKIPYFLVNYADDNQSLFKSFKLDQSEFTETQESLESIESISNMNRNHSIGQNLFDVYNNRSYSVEVDMLGCAQIQPFMYFQLNNIPMFKGAYTIINTRHNVKPNHMTTSFKGVRIRNIKTKLVGSETIYAHLIGNLNDISREGRNFNDLKGPNKVTTKVNENLSLNQTKVMTYFKNLGYRKEVVAGIMGNIQIESSFRISATNERDTNNLVSVGLIQWNFGSYPEVFDLYNKNLFSTVEQQLDFLVNMNSYKTFLRNVLNPYVETKNIENYGNEVENFSKYTIHNEQYIGFLFAHFVEVCCGCAGTRGYDTLREIYEGPYTNGWRCPQDNPNARKFYPHQRSEAASEFMKRFGDSKDNLYWT